MRCLKALSILAVTAAAADASIILDIFGSLDASDPTQLGRLNRNGITSDWSSPKPFPGTINPTISYHYHTYTVSDPFFPFMQITFDDLADTARTFSSAYRNLYVSTNEAANYLGDPGFSGNPAPGVPNVYQVIVPPGNSLVVLVNDTTTTNGGLNQPYHLIVEAFSSTNFDEFTPEPSTLTLSGAGFAVGLLVAFRRLRE
jgi:hypothetical protein